MQKAIYIKGTILAHGETIYKLNQWLDTVWTVVSVTPDNAGGWLVIIQKP